MVAFGLEAFGDGTFGGVSIGAGGPFVVGLVPFRALGFTVDGVPVRAFDWQAESATDHGDRTLTGKFPRDALRAEQGAPVVIWRGPDDALWSGELVADPKVEDDWVTFRAEGHARKLEQDRTRMFYRHDGGEEWVDRDSDPHNIGNDQGYDLTQQAGKLRFVWGQGGTEAFALGNTAGFLLWKEGALITRYEVLTDTNISISNFDLVTHRLTGPSGARTAIATHSIAIGSPTARSSDISSPEDALQFAVSASAGTTPAGKRALTITQIRVYGRTKDDDFSASDVVTDVAGLAGLATANVQTNALAVLPLDWTDGLPALLSYMAELTDWMWLAKHDGIHFRPFGQVTWEAATIAGATPSWEPAERANVFVQPWRGFGGRYRESRATADPNPFPGEERTVYADELEDPQPDGTLASQIAAARVGWESTPRVSGSVDLSTVYYRGAPRSPYDVNPGDHLLMTDLDLGAQRVTAVTYRPNGQVSVQVGEEFNTTALLKELDEDRPRRNRKAKKKKRSKK